MVRENHNIYGLDASILMNPSVWKSSGHVDNFTDLLVSCLNPHCHSCFRLDKSRLSKEKVTMTFSNKAEAKDFIKWVEEKELVKEEELKDLVRKKNVVSGLPRGTAHRVNGEMSYVCCPVCNSPFVSREVRSFNSMFKTSFGPTGKFDVYLRPETAQAIFVQFKNIIQSMSAKIPFGVAQIGKSFRNEMASEHFIYRSVEFEQMELEYFIHPKNWKQEYEEWIKRRFSWWQNILNNPENLRVQKQIDLAHYALACSDIEYMFPWGWGEIEGIAARGDFDLERHGTNSKTKLVAHEEVDGKIEEFIPHVIEPSAGLTRGVLTVLCDALTFDKVHVDKKGRPRTLLKLKPDLAPYKVAVLPLVKNKSQIVEKAQNIFKELQKNGVSSSFDQTHSIGKRYRRHDEIGTPFAITVDFEEGVTIRDRDSTEQVRVSDSNIMNFLNKEGVF